MYTIENHLLHLNMGAGGSRTASSRLPPADFSNEAAADVIKNMIIYYKITMQPVLPEAAAIPTTPCNFLM